MEPKKNEAPTINVWNIPLTEQSEKVRKQLELARDCEKITPSACMTACAFLHATNLARPDTSFLLSGEEIDKYIEKNVKLISIIAQDQPKDYDDFVRILRERGVIGNIPKDQNLEQLKRFLEASNDFLTTLKTARE